MKRIIMAALVLFVASMETSLGAAAFIDNFDSDTVGTIPTSPWSPDNSGSGTTIITNAFSVSAPNSVRLYDPDASTSRAVLNLTFTPKDQALRIEFDYRVSNLTIGGGNDFLTFDIFGDALSGPAKLGPHLRWNNGFFYVANGGPLAYLGTYPVNTFRHYALEANIPANTYTLSIDGTPQGTFGFDTGGITNLWLARWSTSTSPTAGVGEAYLDNVELVVPEPSMLSLLGGAVAVMALARRRR